MYLKLDSHVSELSEKNCWQIVRFHPAVDLPTRIMTPRNTESPGVSLGGEFPSKLSVRARSISKPLDQTEHILLLLLLDQNRELLETKMSVSWTLLETRTRQRKPDPNSVTTV
jgi:hypothetical protein